ncbi:hypothetical protein BDV18DRAFT_161053 [Aspergillus unguis]
MNPISKNSSPTPHPPQAESTVCPSTSEMPVELEAPSRPRSPVEDTPERKQVEPSSGPEQPTARDEYRGLPTGSVAALRKSFMETPLTNGPDKLPLYMTTAIPGPSYTPPTVQAKDESGETDGQRFSEASLGVSLPPFAELSTESSPREKSDTEPAVFQPSRAPSPLSFSTVERPEPLRILRGVARRSSTTLPVQGPDSTASSAVARKQADLHPRIERLHIPTPSNSRQASPVSSPSTLSSPGYEREVLAEQPLQPRNRDNDILLHPALRGEQSREYEERKSKVERFWGIAPPELPKESCVEDEQCKTLQTLCDGCRSILKKVDTVVSRKHLLCPEQTQPVTIECILNGTTEDAASAARTVRTELGHISKSPVALHAASRRSATGGHKAGRWYDLTTMEYPIARSCSSPTDIKRKPNLLQQVFGRRASRDEVKNRRREQEVNTKLRDFRMLIDLPMGIQTGLGLERRIWEVLPRNVKVTKVKYVQGHQMFHRLRWWARTHPAGSDRRPSGNEYTVREYK